MGEVEKARKAKRERKTNTRRREEWIDMNQRTTYSVSKDLSALLPSVSLFLL